MTDTRCSLCHTPTDQASLAEADWAAPEVLEHLQVEHPHWQRQDGACPACIQQALLHILLNQGDAALHQQVQQVWPLDAEAAFGALPTPLRLHADPRYTGQGVTIAMIDTGFYPHPDLIRPTNRIRAWVNAVNDPILVYYFGRDETPDWPNWNAAQSVQWHGQMTSVVAAGNGWLSHGLYRGLASEADLVLIQVRDQEHPITPERIVRALRWIGTSLTGLNIQVVNLSLGGDPVWPLAGNPIDEAVAALVAKGITVVAAAGNDGERRLVPPATAPATLTIGGLDDKSTFDHADLELWHSNYGQAAGGGLKPELVAPSIWVAAPILPGTEVAAEAAHLFAVRAQGEGWIEERLKVLKLITPHYQHVDGTSFAAPLVSSAVACMLQANPNLTPHVIRDVLRNTAQPIPGVTTERQGAGVLNAGPAVALALQEQHGCLNGYPLTPIVTPEGVTFIWHDHTAQRVEVFGSWNDWDAAGLVADLVEAGVWHARLSPLPPGQYSYKFRLDGSRWLDDPTNPQKVPDGFGNFNSLLDVTN